MVQEQSEGPAEIQPVQQGQDEFPSMYEQAGCTQVDLSIDCVQSACWNLLSQSVPTATNCGADECILTMGKSPHCQNTIVQWEGFPHPHCMSMGKSSNFLLFNPLVEW